MSKNNAVKDDTAIWLSYFVFILYIFVTIDWKGEVIGETYTVMHDRAIWHLVWSYILELVVTHANMDLVSKANAVTHDKPMNDIWSGINLYILELRESTLVC